MGSRFVFAERPRPRRRTVRLAVLCAAALALGCAGPGAGPPAPDASRFAQLTQAIGELGAAVSPGDAERAAHEALQASAELAHSYRMTSPALLHNALVNVGFLDRGLCCHWAEDLAARLVKLELASLEVHWVVAYRGRMFREHNSVLLVPNGQGYETGLVLDGWRDSGELVWARPTPDRYPWELHPLDGQWSRLHCR